MRSAEERVAAVRQRAREIEAKRSKQRNRVISVLALTASLLIIVGLSFIIPSVTASFTNAGYTQTGATASIFGGSSSLGYIMIGVLAFALGVVTTILFYRIHGRNKKERDGNDDRIA